MAENTAPQQTTLDDVLKEPVETPTPPPAQNLPTKQAHRDKEQEARGNVRDPATGQYVPKTPPEAPKEPEKVEAKVEAPKEPPKTPEKPVEEYTARERAAFAKAADETRKRQELQRRLAELEKKSTEKPFFDDPDGALARQREELRNEINSAMMASKVHTSESIARSRYPDYDAIYVHFNEMVQQTPHLAEQAFMSNDPADFAYKTAKRDLDLQAAGGVEQMKEKMAAELRAKIKAEIEAEFKKREEDLKREREALPGSLTDVPSKGVNRPVWGGPTRLEDILKS